MRRYNDAYRVRFGADAYRIVYRVDEKRRVVRVFAIGPRGTVYRGIRRMNPDSQKTAASHRCR